MNVLFRLRSACVGEIAEEMPEPVSYSAVRAVLRTLREKALVTHRYDGPRYVYSPVISKEKAKREALAHVVRTFFDDSPEAAAVALLGMADTTLEPEAIERLEAQIQRATREGR